MDFESGGGGSKLSSRSRDTHCQVAGWHSDKALSQSLANNCDTHSHVWSRPHRREECTVNDRLWRGSVVCEQFQYQNHVHLLFVSTSVRG